MIFIDPREVRASIGPPRPAMHAAGAEALCDAIEAVAVLLEPIVGEDAHELAMHVLMAAVPFVRLMAAYEVHAS